MRRYYFDLGARVGSQAFLRQLYEIHAAMNTLRDPMLRPELPTHFFGRLQVALTLTLTYP